MRNIFLLPTPNRSRLILQGSTLHLSKYMEVNEGFSEFNQYICITSDDEIKESDWRVYFKDGVIFKIFKYDDETINNKDCKKIILTTDPELIKNGVQAIPDEFLQWLVNNPTCEEVKVEHDVIDVKGGLEFRPIFGYKIIIPKKELGCPFDEQISYDFLKPKEETLEENEFCHYSGLPSPAAYEIQKPKEFTLEQVELISNEMVNWALDNIGNPNAKSGEKFDEVVSKYKNL